MTPADKIFMKYDIGIYIIREKTFKVLLFQRSVCYFVINSITNNGNKPYQEYITNLFFHFFYFITGTIAYP